jgi:hypothetical protein
MALIITLENNETILELDEILPPNLMSFTSDWRDPKMPNSYLHYDTQKMVNRYYAKRSWPLLPTLKY